MRDDLRIVAGAGGCQIINAAGTYATSADTLIEGVYAIKVITGAAAAITALSMTMPKGSQAAIAALNNIVNADLSDFGGEILTFKWPVTSLTVASGVVLIAYAG